MQQIGRVGRDGEHCFGILCHSGKVQYLVFELCLYFFLPRHCNGVRTFPVWMVVPITYLCGIIDVLLPFPATLVMTPLHPHWPFPMLMPSKPTHYTPTTMLLLLTPPRRPPLPLTSTSVSLRYRRHISITGTLV
jgi:hypothetical protein